MEKQRLEALRLRRRRYLLAFLLLAMMAVALLPILATTGGGRVVQVIDQRPDPVLMDVVTPVSMIITDPLWGEVRLTDSGELFELNQLIRKIPPVAGHFPGDGPDKASGLLTYADGMIKSFSVTSVFRLDNRVYYDESVQEEIRFILETLETKLYTLPRLGGFFDGNYPVLLFSGEESIELQPEDLLQFQSVLLRAETVEDRDEAALVVWNRTPRYTLCVRDARNTDLIVLDIYFNQSTLVYDKYAGLKYVLCFSSELDDLCRQYLKPDIDPAF